MLWPIVLPLKITFWCIAGAIAVATLAAPLMRWRRARAFRVATLLGMLAFIPSCTVVMHVLDERRFGVFQYDAFADVDVLRVERYLPPTAKDITLDKHAQGFRARFRITEAELSAYLDELWQKYGDRSVVARGEMSAMSVVDPESHQLYFGDLGWPHLADATEYYSPTAPNGAGFSIWFSPSEGIAYQRAGYW